jgi:MFS family permease
VPADAGPEPPVISLDHAFRSLRTRNYRLYFIGQLVSLSGTWMQTAALAWLVLHLRGDNSGGALGLVIAAQFLPTLLFGAWGGVIADRFDKRRTLIITQSSMAVVAAVLSVTSVTGAIQMWMVYALSAAMGLGSAVDNPVRQAFVTEMVDREDLPNAVGLSSATFNSARIVGPAIGAGVLAAFGDRVAAGTGVCFAVNALSFLAVLTCLGLMRPAELLRAAPQPRARGQVRAGLRYVAGEPQLRIVLAMMALIGLVGMNFQVVLPLVAKNTFDGGAGVFGALQVAMGVGSLLGSLVAAGRRGEPSVSFLGVAAVIFGAAMLGASAAPTVPVALVLLFLTGIASMTLFAAANTLLQLTARPDMRGRVMALYILLIMGSTPIGGPLVGWIGEHAGARWALAVGGRAGLAGAAVVASEHLTGRRAPATDGAETPAVGLHVPR